MRYVVGSASHARESGPEHATIGGLIGHMRWSRQESMTETARGAGISKSSLSRAEAGGDVSLRTLEKLAKHWDVSVSVKP